MRLKKLLIINFVLVFPFTVTLAQNVLRNISISEIKVGADKTEEYIPLLKGKSVAIIANQSSKIGDIHLVDSLLSRGVDIKKVFCPEHGFRGLSDAGKTVKSYKDNKTGLPIISLYRKNKKPTKEELDDVDIVIFDIQDVGVRFYTYLSTMHYAMESCAENNKKMIVFDRPNPNGFYIDGPLLEDKYKSFLGLHNVPLVYGMTIGEYALMINGEGWLANNIKCDLTVISLQGYTHSDCYQLPIRPSPNLPNMTSIYLYPSLGLFEGTIVSVGRGTNLPFQSIGHPKLTNTRNGDNSDGFTFTPKAMPGAMHPKYKGELCKGYDLTVFGNQYVKSLKKVYLFWLMGTYENTKDKSGFFTKNFNYHAGNSKLQQQIINGVSEEEIRKSWESGINSFKTVRKKYLLYADFE